MTVDSDVTRCDWLQQARIEISSNTIIFHDETFVKMATVEDILNRLSEERQRCYRAHSDAETRQQEPSPVKCHTCRTLQWDNRLIWSLEDLLAWVRANHMDQTDIRDHIDLMLGKYRNEFESRQQASKKQYYKPDCELCSEDPKRCLELVKEHDAAIREDERKKIRAFIRGSEIVPALEQICGKISKAGQANVAADLVQVIECIHSVIPVSGSAEKKIIEVSEECEIFYSDGSHELCKHAPKGSVFQECGLGYGPHGDCPKWDFHHRTVKGDDPK